MPAQPSVRVDAIALKLLASGEKFVRVSFLTLQRGIAHTLVRRRSKPPQLLIDLYDSGEAQVTFSSEGHGNGFLKDFELRQRRAGIGRSYAQLDAAARLSAFFLANPVHIENEQPVFALAQKALDALDQGLAPAAVLLKTYFAYGRDEGYPLVEDWLQQLDVANRAAVAHIVNTPLASLAADPGQQQRSLDLLIGYIERETHIRLE